MKPGWRPGAPAAAVLATLLAAAAFSFYQVGSALFACGRDLAGPETRYWMAFAAIQSALFMAASCSSPARRIYRFVQYASLAIVALPVGQLALAYPRTFVGLGLVAVIYWYGVALGRARAAPGSAYQRGELSSAAVQTTVFLLATILIHSCVVFLVLHSPGLRLDDRAFVAIGAVSALAAAWILKRDAPLPAVSIAQVPPLALLLVVLLRAKYPDAAYDSLFYKATIPIMIADWRTAITGALDHTLLGTDLGEIINSQLRIVDPAYPPALNTALSFIALWVLAPVAAQSLAGTAAGVARPLARNALALLLVSLTESLMAAGTSYQEPLMSLLLAAALLPMSLSWLFMGAAVAVKATALFAVPVILAVKARSLDPLSISAAITAVRVRPVVLSLCMIAAVVTVGEQFYRNVAYTGRLTGVTEMLSGLTDPEGRRLARAEADPFAALTPHGFRERYVNTFIHVLTLDRWIVPSEFGFHILPSSRLPAVGLALCILLPLFAWFRRDRYLMVLLAAWAVGAAALLKMVVQGRYMLPISFAAAVLVAYVAGKLAEASHEAGSNRAVAFGLCGGIAFLAFGDQLVGSFINVGWDCRHDIRAPVTPNNYDRPAAPIERRIADIVTKYRSVAVRQDVVPTVLCENTVDRMRYLGTHYVFAYYTLDLNRRLLAAQPERTQLLPTSLLALCFTDAGFPGQILTPATRAAFTEVEGAKTGSGIAVRLLVSNPLMAGAAATTLAGRQMDPLSWLARRSAPSDLLPLWGPERLTTSAPADAPGGKGALTMDVGGEKLGVLISPHGVMFDNVDFGAGGVLDVELGMPYSNSDGMGVDFVFEGSNGKRASVSVALPPKPQTARSPAWETRRIPLPAGLGGRGSLTINATSPSGNDIADWVFFRQLRFARATP